MANNSIGQVKAFLFVVVFYDVENPTSVLSNGTKNESRCIYSALAVVEDEEGLSVRMGSPARATLKWKVQCILGSDGWPCEMVRVQSLTSTDHLAFSNTIISIFSF